MALFQKSGSEYSNLILSSTRRFVETYHSIVSYQHTMTDVVVQVSAPDDENGNISKEPGTGSANKPSSLPLPFLRVEQLREEGCTSPGSSTYNSDDSEFSDATDAVTRFGEFVPPSPELAKEIVTQVSLTRSFSVTTYLLSYRYRYVRSPIIEMRLDLDFTTVTTADRLNQPLNYVVHQ